MLRGFFSSSVCKGHLLASLVRWLVGRLAAAGCKYFYCSTNLPPKHLTSISLCGATLFNNAVSHSAFILSTFLKTLCKYLFLGFTFHNLPHIRLQITPQHSPLGIETFVILTKLNNDYFGSADQTTATMRIYKYGSAGTSS